MTMTARSPDPLLGIWWKGGVELVPSEAEGTPPKQNVARYAHLCAVVLAACGLSGLFALDFASPQ
jgi:hypothetical protein